MSGPFRSFCRYQAHSLRIHLCRIQGRRRNRQPQHHGRRSWSVVKNVYFYSSWFLVQFVKTPRAVFQEQGLVFPTCSLVRRHRPHSLNPYRSPRPQLHQENVYHGSWSNPWVPEKVQEIQHSPVELQRRSQSMEIVLHPPWHNWRCCCIGPLEAEASSLYLGSKKEPQGVDCLSTESKADRKSTYATHPRWFSVFTYCL